MSRPYCPIHECDFLACPCPDRRNTTRVQQVIVCRVCNRHVSRCECAQPELEPRSAA